MTEKDKKTMCAENGYIWVQAHHTNQEGQERKIIDDVEYIKVATFHENVDPSRVWYSMERKFQIKQYEPLKISMGLSMPCYKEELEPALNETIEILEKTFKSKINEIKQILNKK